MPDMSLRPGEAFAGYVIQRELGSGGMGAVYLARHPRLPRYDAIKLLRPELCNDPAFVGRFEREADTVAQLDHPNIVSVYDRGSSDGQLWISMRFIDGTNAERALAEYAGGMPPDRAVRIISRVASALDYAHRHQLLHRDVKPANILLAAGADDDESERVFLSDFGVAKAIGAAADRLASLTSTGSVVATLDYASPEQIRGLALDHRSDIYALGCVLYKLLTGVVPFPGDSIASRVYDHLNRSVRPPSELVDGLPAGFDEVVATAMAKDPEDRYPNCRALARAAAAALADTVASDARPAALDSDAELATTITPRPPIRSESGESATPLGSSGPSTGSPGMTGRTTPPVPAGPATAEPVAQTPADGPVPGASGPAAGSVTAPASVTTPALRTGRHRSRYVVVIGGLVAALVIAGGTWAVLSRDGIAGTAGPAIESSPASTPASSDLTTPSAGAATSPSAVTTAGPVPGLPHSTPLPEQVLLSSRVVDGATNLYQVDAADGVVGDQITSNAPGPAYPILSPDRGSMIFVQAGGAGGSSLLTAAVDGSGQRDLLNQRPAGCDSFLRPAWNPIDQTVIALPCVSAGTTTVHLIAVDSQTDSGVIDLGFPFVDDLTFAPDGATVAFWAADSAQAQGTIYLRPADGSGRATMLAAPESGSSDADPAFSPDGTKIAFRRLVTEPGGQVTAHIVVVGVDGSNPTQLTDGQFADQDPIWSPDGQHIAFKSNRPNAAGTTDNQIWVIGADGTGLTQLGASSPGMADGAPAWGHR
jgi:serine/threonine-protein kinase